MFGVKKQSLLKTTLSDVKRNRSGLFDKVKFGTLILSIQGSNTHYCSPRIKLDNLLYYDSVEIALLEEKNNLEDFVNVRDDDRFKNFSWAERFETGEYPVAGYISQSVLETIISDLIIVSNRMKN